ncbi:MAG TPA: DUF2232 domain-containing protein [Candidatus Sumerlaeota bacterium]|nr:DUF2232 domain-containing protein [Candidatus Sumerlaeota bacterium]HPK01341.1 DUF2232 domain-containing protein [Candidatus Sumerlaeota bacterium]
MLLGAALAAVTVLAIVISAVGLAGGIVGGCLAAAAYWAAFDRASPPLVGLVLIGVVLATYYVLPELAVLWVMASALAGATGVWLNRAGGREDDYFFLPAAATLAAFAILVWLGQGGRLDGPLEALRESPTQLLNLIEQENARLIEQRQAPLFNPTQLEQLREYLPRAWVPTLVALWVLALWLTGRVVRRAIGRFQPSRSLLVLFRLSQRYIFVLIAGLFFAILGSLYAWPTAWRIALPLLAVMYVAALVQGIAVLLFTAALRRKMGQPGLAAAMTWGGLILFIGFIRVPIGALLGLMDVWLDFRRLERRGAS